MKLPEPVEKVVDKVLAYHQVADSLPRSTQQSDATVASQVVNTSELSIKKESLTDRDEISTILDVYDSTRTTDIGPRTTRLNARSTRRKTNSAREHARTLGARGIGD